MISIVKTNYKTSDKSGEYFVGDLAGLSTDAKPTEIDSMKVGNGCSFIEIDTGKLFFFDLENELWKEV